MCTGRAGSTETGSVMISGGGDGEVGQRNGHADNEKG